MVVNRTSMLSFKTADDSQVVNLLPLGEAHLGGGDCCIGDTGQPMPVAVIAISMLMMVVVATPSAASPSCMSKAEARQHFGSLHIYWHGPDRCWDATPARRLVRFHSDRAHRRQHEVWRNIDQPKWHESMSEMLSDE